MFLTIKMYEQVASKSSVEVFLLQTAKIAWKFLEIFRIYTGIIVYILVILHSVQILINNHLKYESTEFIRMRYTSKLQ